MKRLGFLLLGMVTSLPLFAGTYTFVPGDSQNDMDDLDHHNAVTWGIVWNIPAGETITGAQLRIDNIWDWKVESDSLFIHLLDDPKLGRNSWVDNTGDNVQQDFFAGQGIHLDTWHDPNGGVDTGFDYIYTFTAANITSLNGYITDWNASDRADFGFGFDPDCHYYNTGICFTITTKTTQREVPDTGSAAGLLLLGLVTLGGMAWKSRTVVA